MKKLRWNVIGYIVLLAMAGALLYHMCHSTNQARNAIVVDLDFVGEYSMDGGDNWKILDTGVSFSGFDGDLLLRGRFDENFSAYVSFYLNHIGVIISVNGREVFESGRTRDEIPEKICGSYWSSWLYEEAGPEDVIEIRLHNPHQYGNPNAYNEFLDSLHLGAGTPLAEHLDSQSMPYRIAGSFMIVVSVALLGMALGYFVQKLPSASLLWSFGMLSLYMSGYILIDTPDIMFRSNLTAFNTCIRQLSMMFAALELVNIIRKLTDDGKGYRIAKTVCIVLGAVNGILLILAFAEIVELYDTGLYWAAAQGIGILVLLILCVCQYCQGISRNKRMMIDGMLLLFTVLLEILNGRTGWWTSGILIKIVYVIIFMTELIRAVKLVAVNQKESLRAKELAAELRNSRIVLAMSQIRTHFIFNVLTAISGMCEYDPKKADETLIRFSRYLRSNIDIMEEDSLEPFSKSLEHLKDYVALEQIRFGDKLQFVTDLETTDFKLPPLVLQPIVENSIKHGLFPKTEGGTITLYTKKQDHEIMIMIQDDGVGFDIEKVPKEGSVGLKNVRFRLEHMVNGRLDVESSPGNGTKVTVIIPVE